MIDALAPQTSFAMLQAAQGGASEKAASLKAAAKTGAGDPLTEAAQDFEAMFVAEMLKPMFEDIKPDPVFGGGKGEEIFQGMMLEQYGKIIAQSGGIGIADAVREELVKIQEKQNVQETDAAG